MGYSDYDLTFIADRTNDRCHLCGGKIIFSHYGRIDTSTGWEVDHSNPKSVGGSERLSNKLPAHYDCNRAKGNRSTRSYRRKYGLTNKPKSRNQIYEEDDILEPIVGAIGFVAVTFGVMAILSALFGNQNPQLQLYGSLTNSPYRKYF